MRTIFLSASIPDAARHPRYFATMDVIAIRDAVRALATVVLPHACLVWGGHPSITPLIRVVAESVGVVGGPHVRLFQSAWFNGILPEDNAAFEQYELTPSQATMEESIAVMRQRMLSAADFNAAIFIGGMEGVEVEFDMFRSMHPNAKVWPVATTGAAAKIVYDKYRNALEFPSSLDGNFAYPSLFRGILNLD